MFCLCVGRITNARLLVPFLNRSHVCYLVHMSPTPPSLRSATPLRPASYAGIAAALVSIVGTIVLRAAPAAEALVSPVHLALVLLLYVTGGALAARLGGEGWRAGLFAGLLDALIGHAMAFFIAPAPDASRIQAPPGREITPQLLHAMHLWGAVAGALFTIVLGIVGGAVGSWYARRSGVAPRRTRAS
jgi:uncharacterized membrane protein YeaQ/YmgE (transglycosylase-associated protein family)